MRDVYSDVETSDDDSEEKEEDKEYNQLFESDSGEEDVSDSDEDLGKESDF